MTRSAVPPPDAASNTVLVVGAGPVGLLLAGELRRAGVPVIVVERLASPMTESRASQLNTLTAELLCERGFDSLLAEAVPEPRAHFGGLPLDLSGLPSEYAGNWKVPQYRTESVLRARAERLGAVLLWAHELSGISESGEHILCQLDSPSGERRIRARYVVGCDGASSTVRRLGGFGVSAVGATKEMLRADVTGIEIADRRFERLERGLAVAMTRDGVTRVMVHGRDRGVAARAKAPRFDEIAAVWKSVTGEEIAGGTAIWVDSFDNSRGLVTRYQRGRMLVAGDAAHWHMPIGGQALNVGLQDAVNLGWKLAGAVHGWSPPDLLASYHDERHAAAAAVLDSVAAQEVLLLGGGEVGPLCAVLAELLELRDVSDQLARSAAGLDVRYGAGEHPLTGRRLPLVGLQSRSGPVTRADLTGARGVILRLAGPGPRRASTARTGGCRVRTVDAWPAQPGALDGVDTILLRPDGYIAWAGTDEAGLDSALARWFGAPAAATG